MIAPALLAIALHANALNATARDSLPRGSHEWRPSVSPPARSGPKVGEGQRASEATPAATVPAPIATTSPTTHRERGVPRRTSGGLMGGGTHGGNGSGIVSCVACAAGGEEQQVAAMGNDR